MNLDGSGYSGLWLFQVEHNGRACADDDFSAGLVTPQIHISPDRDVPGSSIRKLKRGLSLIRADGRDLGRLFHRGGLKHAGRFAVLNQFLRD